MRRALDTMENLKPETLIECWTLRVEVPALCPVSKNPREGSHLTVAYQPAAKFLEVYALRNFVRSYMGGIAARGEEAAIRDMEQTIQSIAQSCAQAVETQVRVSAYLELDVGTMTIEVLARYLPTH